MSNENNLFGRLDKTMLLALVISTSIIFVTMMVIIFCYCRKYRRKEIAKFEYIEDSDKQPFVEEVDTAQPDALLPGPENKDLEAGLLAREQASSSIVSFDEKDITATTTITTIPTECPFKRIKSYTISGCSHKGFSKDAFKKKRTASDETTEIHKAELDCLQLETGIYDSFTKLKDIYDYQSARYLENKKFYSAVEDAEEANNRFPVGEIFESDETFDRVKDLYDRVSTNLVSKKQVDLTDRNGSVSSTVSVSENNPLEMDSSVFT